MALPYLDSVVHETLRLESPVPMFGRQATEDAVLPLSKPIIGRDGSVIESLAIKKGECIDIRRSHPIQRG